MLVDLTIIAERLTQIAGANSDLRATTPTPFDALCAPTISLHSYLARIYKFSRFDPLCFLIAVAYVNRLALVDNSFRPTRYNIHRMLVTALLVASKANDDIYHDNRSIAQCGGVSVTELCSLEAELCRRLSWALFIEQPEVDLLVAALSDPCSSYWGGWSNLAVHQKCSMLPLVATSPLVSFQRDAEFASTRACKAECELKLCANGQGTGEFITGDGTSMPRNDSFPTMLGKLFCIASGALHRSPTEEGLKALDGTATRRPALASLRRSFSHVGQYIGRVLSSDT